ncbi:MAG: polysaccharide deacetylase family protein [Bryobacterales bacterium]|nr:polysaccharide deacetylase family protein [Bryobacterales bacterium]
MPDGAVIGGSVGLLVAGGFLAHAARGRASTVFGPSVYHGDRARPAIALTFDDGPSESTVALLKILARHQVPATFFMCGKNVERLPGVARAVAAAGHEIGNHSDSHRRFEFRSPTFIYDELARGQKKIAAHTGVTPKLFRAPYGVRWFGLKSAQDRLGLLGVMWGIMGNDWKWPASRVAALLLDRARYGEIICLHDGRTTQVAPDVQSTLEAVDKIIPQLKQRGLHFETVSQILCPTKT